MGGKRISVSLEDKPGSGEGVVVVVDEDAAGATQSPRRTAEGSKLRLSSGTPAACSAALFDLRPGE